MSLNLCGNCTNWRDCPGNIEWFAPSEIRYCKRQNLWLIAQFLVCESDRIAMARFTWPGEDKATGYTEAPRTGYGAVKAHAPYERVVEIVSELAWRLNRTGKDGRLLVMEIKLEGGLSRDALNALWYVVGRRHKTSSYQDWLKQRKYLNKKKNYYQKVVEGS